jgi:hypothetical protein
MLFLASEQLNDDSVVLTHEPDESNDLEFKGENFIDNVDVSKLDYKHREYK